jgi:photosystem II stability/assembly factor-like uncharacterized protein
MNLLFRFGWRLLAAAPLLFTAHTSSLHASAPAQIDSISFISASYGWAALSGSSRATELLQTANAGRTWRHTTVPAEDLQIRFFDAHHGWATGLEPVGCSDTARADKCDGVILHTFDGGRTWSAVRRSRGVQYQSLAYLSGGHTAWFSARSRSCNASCPVVQTSDSGRDWRMETSFPAGTSSVDFVDQRTGWLSVTHCDANDRKPRTVVKVTHNGGRTWRTTLAVPLHCGAGISFVNRRDGWVLVDEAFEQCSMGGCGGYVLEHTTDGGVHWHVEQGNTNLRSNSYWWKREGFPGSPTFLPDGTGWIGFSGGAGPGFGGVLITTDGGVHWRRTLSWYQPPDLGDNLSLVNSHVGWFAGCYKHGVCRSLLRTVDAGRHWKAVSLPRA